MADVGPPDMFFLSSAIGWLELGNASEALAEWQGISGANRTHPDVLETGWRIHSAMKSWTAALDFARRQVEVTPDHPSGWINQSYALHELKRTQEAYDLLQPLSARFPKVGVIPYNLACYCCQLGNRALAENYLGLAIALRGRDEIKQMAMADHDLEPMRDHIVAL